MTKQEAIELLLENKPIVHCEHCIDSVLICVHCHTVRWVVNVQWVEASLLMETMSEEGALSILRDEVNRWSPFQDKIITNPEYILALAVFGMNKMDDMRNTQAEIYRKALRIYKNKRAVWRVMKP